jgi:PIN domain nuclease of toxin-antitoxin system
MPADRTLAIIDASALLAFLFDEPGADRTADVLHRAAISTVNWTEVVQHVLGRGGTTTATRDDLLDAGLQIVPFSIDDAELAAAWREPTRALGLSLADRACLALAYRADRPALTANRSWRAVDLGVEVDVIR